MQLFLKTPSFREPLNLEEVKTYLRLSTDHEDDFLSSLISSARAYVESATGRSLLKQKWLMVITPPYPQTFPLVKRGDKTLGITLPKPPILEVETVKSEGKDVPFLREKNKILLSATLWDREVAITYWSGYGEEATSLPPDLKMAVLMATRLLYDNQKLDLPLLKPFKVLRVV